MKKRVISIILATLLIVTMIPAMHLSVSAAENVTVTIDTGASVTLKDSDGDGYYEIGNADELYAFAAAVNGGKKTLDGELTANIVVNENVLNEDGTLNGDGSNFREWTPIGNSFSNYYSGAFDGKDHTVSGLYVNNGEQSVVGLFGYVTGIPIQNVGVIDSYLVCQNNVGGVVGYSNYSTISNCYNTGTVSGSDRVGGVVGYSNYSTISNCNKSGSVSGDEKIGGVVGYSHDSTISNCYNTGAVNGSDFVGGVSGHITNSSTVSNCYNIGTISGDSRVGGVVGDIEGNSTVSNCYNTGAVSSSGGAGGVIGAGNECNFLNCYNTGAVSGGNNSVGGVAGAFSESVFLNCYNTGIVTSDDDAGGVLGYGYYCDIKNCYNLGSVSGIKYVGGVVGENTVNHVENCYYLDTCGAGGKGISATAEQFIGGEIAYLLQGEQEELIWGQSIGEDLSPVLGGKKVYFMIGCDGTTVAGYANIEGITGVHTYGEDGFCIRCEVECAHVYDQETHKCTVCGVECTDHKYIISSAFNPTCSAQGAIIYKCSDCGFEYGDVLPAKGHKITYTVTDTVHKGVCSSCGYVKEGFHNYSQTYTYETCTEDAYFTYTCDDCGYSYTRASTEKLGHTGGRATCKALAICERCDEPYGEYADHIGGEATCYTKAVCDFCGMEYGELERHSSDFDDGDCTTDILCSVCGAVTTKGNDMHVWDEDNSCQNPGCYETKGLTLTFTYGDEILFVRNVNAHHYYDFEGAEDRGELSLLGWDEDGDGVVDYTVGDYVYVSEDMEFEAVYGLLYTVRFITYDIWEGAYTESFNPIVSKADEIVTLYDDFSPYYKFLGWSLEEGGEIVYAPNEEVILESDLLLYGVIRPYRATFDIGEGATWTDENGEPITELYGDYSGSWIEIYDFPVRPGYIFKGFIDQTEWFWEPWQDEETGVWILDFYFDMRDLEMKAVWEECTDHSFADGVCSLCGKADSQEEEYLIGDVNGDGIVNGKDSNMLKQIISGAVAVTEEMIVVCDMHKDGSINGMDANLLARFIAGEIAGF